MGVTIKEKTMLKSLIDYSGEGQIMQMSPEALQYVMLDQMEKTKTSYTEAVKRPEFQQWGILQIFHKRMDAMSVDMTDQLAFAALDTADNPARAVMWAFTLNRIAKENPEVKILDCELVFMRYFPEGIPSIASMNALWLECKTEVGTGNGMDDFSNWDK
jgi:hypothetical protein